MSSQRPRLVDVAKYAGVSVQTVSNVLNYRFGEVGPATRDRVEDAMRHLGYVPNVQARSLRSHRTNTLAFLLLDPDPKYLADPMTDLIISGVGAVARERGYMVLVHASPPSSVDTGLLLPIHQNRADGALLLLSGEPVLRKAYVDQIKTITTRFVVFEDIDDTDVDTVTANNRDGAYRMVHHLVEKGHRRIGFIGTGTPWPMVEQRYEGYLAALRDAGITYEPALSRFEGAWDAATGERLVGQLFNEFEPPTALMAGNDLIAIGAIKALKLRGVRVPEEFAVTGFDDFSFAEHVDPPLTTVRIPGFEMGYRAATKLIDSIEGTQTRPSADRLPVELMIRGSA